MTVTNKKLYDSGLKVRRAVLGAEYVDPQIELAKTDPVVGAIQDMVTEYCWGYISHITTFLDNETKTWFMYYLNRAGDAFRVKTASVSVLIP